MALVKGLKSPQVENHLEAGVDLWLSDMRIWAYKKKIILEKFIQEERTSNRILKAEM